MSNAARSRSEARCTTPPRGAFPVFIFAGLSPFTQEGERTGSRNEFIQWIQDVHDQRGIVRQYVKYENEIRTGKNVKQIVHRAMQFAHSAPRGPVYVTGAREVMEEETERVDIDLAQWPQIARAALPPEDVARSARRSRRRETAAGRDLLSRPRVREPSASSRVYAAASASACSNPCRIA